MVATIYYEFGSFSIDPVRRLLYQGDKQVPLAAKPFDLLIELIQSAGQPVSKHTLMEQVWRGAEVSDNTFNVTLSAVRKVLGESARDRQYIITSPDGYCLVAEIRTVVIGEVSQASATTDPMPAIKSGDERPAVGGRHPLLRKWPGRLLIIAFFVALIFATLVFFGRRGYEQIPQALPSTTAGIISVDGYTYEWAEIKPLLTDALGDGPFDPYGKYHKSLDFISISVTNDDANLYLALEFADNYTGGIKLYLDTDLDTTTGCDGAEYIIFVGPSAPGAGLALADGRSCAFKNDYPDAIISEARGRFAEAAISIIALRSITPRLKGVSIWANAIAPGRGVFDDVGPPATYLFK